MTDLKFQAISGQYKNFTRMSPTDFENLINLIGPKIAKQDTFMRKSNTVQERLSITLCFLATGVVALLFTSTLFVSPPRNNPLMRFKFTDNSWDEAQLRRVSTFVTRRCYAFTSTLRLLLRVYVTLQRYDTRKCYKCVRGLT